MKTQSFRLLLMTDAGPFDVLGFIGDGRRYEDIAMLRILEAVQGRTLRS